MKNKFNNLTSKEWLPFQKSWFRHISDRFLYRDNIRFFTKIENTDEHVLYFGDKMEIFNNIAHEYQLKVSPLVEFKGKTQYIFIDMRTELDRCKNIDEYYRFKHLIISEVQKQLTNLTERRFVSIIAKNFQYYGTYYPYAWDIAKSISCILSLKDEKIGCLDSDQSEEKTNKFFAPKQNIYYCLYFRKDEYSSINNKYSDFDFFQNNTQDISRRKFDKSIPFWFILKPQPRKKDEILHPAKFPEDLAEIFINTFSNENENIIDPMAGTGSSQLAALKLKRNGYGTELSEFFAGITDRRCREYIEPKQRTLIFEEKKQKFKILNKDARLIQKDDFPIIHYMITSPPYWDMLNVKGAENQAKRIEKGLQTNYSDSPNDLGNIENYTEFIHTLKDIYLNIALIMETGSYMTIVVKNIKKKGRNYPLAWDLSLVLQEKLIFLPEVMWCQDDIRIAPYGYGNTFVSNTFHQYCLNFQIPENFI